MTDRDLAVFLLWKSVKDRLGIKFSVLQSALHDWEIVPLERDGQIVGAFAVKEGEVHLGFGELPKGSIRKYVHTVFQPVMERFGSLRTSVLETNPKGIRFCARMGFEEVKRENGLVHMQCKRLNYV